MLGDAWQAWWVVLAGTGAAVALGALLQATLAAEAMAFMPIAALGAVTFCILLGCILLFQGERSAEHGQAARATCRCRCSACSVGHISQPQDAVSQSASGRTEAACLLPVRICWLLQ